MFCPYGSIKKIESLGVNPSDIKERDVCTKTDENNICFKHISTAFDDKIRQDLSKMQTNNYTTSYLDSELFQTVEGKEVDQKCLGEGAYLYV